MAISILAASDDAFFPTLMVGLVAFVRGGGGGWTGGDAEALALSISKLAQHFPQICRSINEFVEIRFACPQLGQETTILLLFAVLDIICRIISEQTLTALSLAIVF